MTPEQLREAGEMRERFWSKVKAVGGCWEWTASVRTTGYGSFRFDGEMRSAHRVAWEIVNGPIPDGDGYHGVCVLHRCDNRLCVAPHHLYLGDHAENMNDMVAKGRHVPPGRKGEDHPTAKLTEKDVRAIRADPRFQKDIGDEYGVSQATVSYIKSRKKWGHINDDVNTNRALTGNQEWGE